MGIENMELYCFNAMERTCVGMWDCASEPGWYWARYGIRNGSWEEIDGGLLTVEVDDVGAIIEGYATLREAFEAEARRDGDEECSESLFTAVAELSEAQFVYRMAEREAAEQLRDIHIAESDYRAELQLFLAAA